MSAAIVKKTLGLAPAVEAHFWGWLEELDASLADERGQLEGALVFVRDSFEVTDNKALTIAVDIVDNARTRIKALEAERTKFTGPLLAAKAAVDQVFKASTGPLANSIESAKQKMSAYTIRLDQDRRDAMARSASLYVAGGTPTEVIPEPPAAVGAIFRKVWRAQVVDSELVPRELCTPDTARIAAAIAYADTDTPPRPIPGLEFYQEQLVTVRGARK